MDSAQEHAARTDHRTEALLCAVRTCASVTSDLLARHPRAEELKRFAADHDDDDRPLSKLLWQELLEEERACLGPRGAYYVDPAEGSAARFWQRRARLAGWKQRRDAAARLPWPWPQVLEMPTSTARRLCAIIGIEMVTRAFAATSLQKNVALLGPLGVDLAQFVIERLRRSAPPPVSKTVADRWRDAYGRMARDATGESIVAGLGRSLLAALFRRLPEDSRAAAAALSRSNLPQVMLADLFLEPVTPEELSLCGTLAVRGLDRASAKDPRREGATAR